MRAENPILQVKNLQVDFLVKKHTITAVKDVSFSVDKGTTLGIVGESGCGKSVTATSIMRLLPRQYSKISQGQICLDGEDLLAKSEEEMYKIRGTKVSMIFQDPLTSLNPVYTIGTQLCEVLLTHKIADKKQAERTKRMPTGWIAPEELPANMMMTTPATGRKLKRIWRRVGNSFKKRAESPIARIGIRDNTTPVNMLLVRAMP